MHYCILLKFDLMFIQCLYYKHVLLLKIVTLHCLMQLRHGTSTGNLLGQVLMAGRRIHLTWGRVLWGQSKSSTLVWYMMQHPLNTKRSSARSDTATGNCSWSRETTALVVVKCQRPPSTIHPSRSQIWKARFQWSGQWQMLGGRGASTKQWCIPQPASMSPWCLRGSCFTGTARRSASPLNLRWLLQPETMFSGRYHGGAGDRGWPRRWSSVLWVRGRVYRCRAKWIWRLKFWFATFVGRVV